MPRKDGNADNQRNVDENNQNGIVEEEHVQENQYEFPGYNPDDSYIDEENFGHGFDEKMNRTVLRGPEDEAPEQPAGAPQEQPAGARPGQPVGAPQEQPVGAQPGQPAAPFEPEKPDFADVFSSRGEYRHPRAYYKAMYQTLKIFEQAPIEDVDDQIACCRYLTALELLSDGQAETISRSFPMFGEQAEISMDLEEAWKLVHGRGRNGVLNLDRVMGLPLNGSTFGAIAAEKNTAYGCEQYITASANYIRERENQPYPGRETVLEQLPYKYAGNRVFRGPEEFAARLRTNEVPPELNMTAADIGRRLQEIAQPYMDRNGGVLDPNLMSEADRQEYDCLNGAKTWHSTYIASAHIIDAYLEHNPTVYSFKQNLNMSDHFTVLARYTADPAFRSTVKQMTAFEQKAEMGFSFSEVRQHGEALLQSEQVRRASGGLYGAVKAVGSGDLSRFEELVQLDDGYARLLALNHFARVLQEELDPRGEKIRPDEPMCDVINELHNEQDFQRVCERHAGDPLFRKAIASLRDIAEKNARLTASGWGFAEVNLRELDRRLNRAVLRNTLAPVDAERIRNLQAGMGAEGDLRKLAGAVSDNMRKQAVLAKFLFLAHLGKRLETRFDGVSYNTALTNAPVSELFAHGTHARFNLSVGGKEEKRELNQAIYGENALEDGLVYEPATSSYLVEPHHFRQDGAILGVGTLEKYTHLKGTRKLDIGIGGIGNIGPGGAVITDDGSSGVINMVQRLGEDDQADTFEVNIEGARYGSKSALGTPSSTRENLNVLSGMLSRKNSEAEKRNEVFLHNVSAANLKNLVNRFDRYYRKLQREALTDPEKAEELAELHETLSGKTMKSEELTAFLNNVLGIRPRDAQKLVTVSRLDPEKHLPEDTDFEIAPPADPYENLDEEGLRAAKANERHELEGILLNKLYGAKLVQEEMKPNVQEEWEQEEAAEEQAELVTLDQYLHSSAARLGTLSKKEQNKLVCRMIDAVNRNKGNLRAAVDPEKLNDKRIGRIPSIAYQLRHSQRKLVDDARKGKIVALMRGTTELYRVLSAEQAADNQAIQKLRELYNALNVPNLENRTKEYQSMVGAIGSVSTKTKLTPEDKLYVINAVEHYASEKRVVPSSENGKLSLNYGYEAIKAVAASPEAQETFLRPLEQNITRLQDAMLRKNLITEERMIRLPEQEEPEEAQAGQNDAAVQPAGQHRWAPENF